MKKTKVELWLSSEEVAEITRLARSLKISRSQYLRLCAMNGLSSKSESPTSGEELRDLRNEFSALQDGLREAFSELLDRIGEIIRVPSFREYRARAAAEGVARRENESEEQFLARLAQRYYVAYRAWPNKNETRSFGPVPSGFDFSKFPDRSPTP